MFVDTTARTDAPEIMDDFSIEGESLHGALDKIAQINRMLGGNAVTLQGVSELLSDLPYDRPVSIVDLGCGNGDMLRALADFALKNNRIFRLMGVDANQHTIAYARERSVKYPAIQFEHMDIFGATFDTLEYDIALCTLTLHHFSENEVTALLQKITSKATVGIVVNDLHRNALAYYLFHIISVLFRLKELPRNDGLVSILRGFKRKELVNLSEKLHLKKYSLRWKWAFRYQWIIPTI